jgi:hypothetical protein
LSTAIAVKLLALIEANGTELINCPPYNREWVSRRGAESLSARGSKVLKEERTSKMFNANRDGLDRHLDDVGSKAATERGPALNGLAGSTRKFLTVVKESLMISASSLALDVLNRFTDDAATRMSTGINRVLHGETLDLRDETWDCAKVREVPNSSEDEPVLSARVGAIVCH